MPNQWFIRRREETSHRGPHSDRELRSAAEAGQLGPNDFIWKEGMKEWVPASKVRGLFKTSVAIDGSVVRPEDGTCSEVDHGTGPVYLGPSKKKIDSAKPGNVPLPSVSRPSPPSPAPASPASSSQRRTASQPSNVSPLPATGAKQVVPHPGPSVQPSVVPPSQKTTPPKTPAPPADPFGFGAPAPAADGFATGMGDLSALSQAIQSAPAIPRAAPPAQDFDGGHLGKTGQPFPANRTPSKNNTEKMMWLPLPFVTAIPFSFIVGCINAVIPICLCFIGIAILGGVGKVLGELSGHCIKKTGIRHDNFSYLFGGAVGVVACYFLWSSYFFVQANIVATMMQPAMQILESEENLVEDEEAMADEEGAIEERAADPTIPHPMEQGLSAGDRAKLQNARNQLDQLKNVGVDVLFSHVGIFKAIWPFSLAKYVFFRLRAEVFWFHIVWFIEISTLVGAASQSSWASVHRRR